MSNNNKNNSTKSNKINNNKSRKDLTVNNKNSKIMNTNKNKMKNNTLIITLTEINKNSNISMMKINSKIDMESMIKTTKMMMAEPQNINSKKSKLSMLMDKTTLDSCTILLSERFSDIIK